MREGTASQSLSFDFELTPAPSATYRVGGVGTSDLWSIAVFFSPNPGGDPVLVGEQRLTTLTEDQRTTEWDPPNTTIISGVQAHGVIVPANVICSQIGYFCARLQKGASPFPEFELTGDPDENSLLGCTSVTCRGKLYTGWPLPPKKTKKTKREQSIFQDFALINSFLFHLAG